MRASKKLKRLVEYWFFRGFFLLALLPRRPGQWLFAKMSEVAGRISSKDWQRAEANLAIAFPEADRMILRAMTRATFQALGRNVYEFLAMSRSRPGDLGKRIERIHGLERIAATFGKGRGMIVLTGHIGCWELMPAYFCGQGYPVSAVARRMRLSRLNDKLVEIRARFGVRTLDRETSPREMLQVLHRGEVLGVLIDQHTSVAGAWVPFFGRLAHTPTAVAKIAMLTGAPILPMAIYLGRTGRHVVHVLEPMFPPARPENREEAILDLTARCSRAIEQMIRIDPKQWVWFHHRWREPREEEERYVAQG